MQETMMGQITVLCVFVPRKDGEYDFAIPVSNFPIIPVGERVELELGGMVLESLEITSYEASNRKGNSVNVIWEQSELTDDAPSDSGLGVFAKVKALMLSEEKYGCSHVYPDTIHFG